MIALTKKKQKEFVFLLQSKIRHGLKTEIASINKNNFPKPPLTTIPHHSIEERGRPATFLLTFTQNNTDRQRERGTRSDDEKT